MGIRFSKNLAVLLGLLTPLLETIRRWNTWLDDPPAFFDDYILGGFLLFAAWQVSRNVVRGQRFLGAAWGFACGMVYPSFFSQLEHIRLGVADPAPVSSAWVGIIKGVGFVFVIVGLITSLRKIPEEVLKPNGSFDYS